ncbi:MAG: hypothetical protein C0453_09395 [Comamonadaceae bacterium]|nr:hypothetical protein [Comamonadaceae bacterium]
MKSFVRRGVWSLLLVPACVLAADQRPVTVPTESVMSVVPLSMMEPETRATVRLRETLRQPYDDEIEQNKPYRLSAEERVRLREQLRGDFSQAKFPR